MGDFVCLKGDSNQNFQSWEEMRAHSSAKDEEYLMSASSGKSITSHKTKLKGVNST